MALRRSRAGFRTGPGAGRRAADDHRRGASAVLDAAIRLVLTGTTARAEPAAGGELESLPLPDLLFARPGPGPDPEALLNLLELGFLGRSSAGELDAELDQMGVGETRWTADHFADDLFLGELVKEWLAVEVAGKRLPSHRGFLQRLLASPPPDLETCLFRQGILRELESAPAVLALTERLVGAIHHLLSLLRATRDDARLEPVRFRVDVLGAFRSVVNDMAQGYAASVSGLRRLHEAGETIRASAAFRRMEALLDHRSSMAHLRLGVVVGADGRLRHLQVEGLEERRDNPFYRRPLRRWWDRARLLYHRCSVDSDELVDRLVMGVYQEVAPAVARVVQLLCPLEVYLASRSSAALTRARGLEACLPRLEAGAWLAVEGLFNPLLLTLLQRPVPTDLRCEAARPVTLVTGPNSGGKTRLLQALGIAQVLGQSGLYAPCSRATLPFVPGLFASIVEVDRADQPEGRLGTELVRLRTLFETVPPGSLVLLDELCSGTNPSEAIEIVDMVLRLLRRLEPVAFVTTHFLDFARQLQAEAPAHALAFLQAEVDPELGPTYRFTPGVATTSLAVGTARRLGVTFAELESTLDRRRGGPGFSR